MQFHSKALKANLVRTDVAVEIDPKYGVLLEVLSKYYGIMEGFKVFLKELSHPYRNWQFIVQESRGYALDYFNLLKSHPKGPHAARLYLDVFFAAIDHSTQLEVRTDAIDNLLLYLSKIIKESGDDLHRFMPVLNDAFDRIRMVDNDCFLLFLKSYYQMKRMAQALVNAGPPPAWDFTALNLLLIEYYRQSYEYWLSQTDPLDWLKKKKLKDDQELNYDDIFAGITHSAISGHRLELDRVCHRRPKSAYATLEAMLSLPGYADIAGKYRAVPRSLRAAGTENRKGNIWKVIFLFHIMNISGLSMIHEEALREINRTMGWLIEHESPRALRELLKKTFAILKGQTLLFPTTALNCVLNMGHAVYKTDDTGLIGFFNKAVIDLGFQTPMIGGVTNDWQIKANSAHLQNIRTWLELCDLNPKRSTRLISSLMIYLSICGVFVKDTDLFFRDITRLLNSDIGPVYNLVKQLARLFPAYFNEIGAEGQLRDISTEVDEATGRKDVLIHFLRKQSHVESSNRIIFFMDAIFGFWETRRKQGLKAYVPPDIYSRIQLQGPYIDGVQRAMTQFKKKGLILPGAFLSLSEETLSNTLNSMQGVPELDRRRVYLAATFYKLLNQKYNLKMIDLSQISKQAAGEPLPAIDQLKLALAETEPFKKLPKLLVYLEKLQNVILSPDRYEICEDIYKKRHFAVDIPSMYGSYRELKFDSLGLTFRLESIVNVLFEQLVDTIDLGLITKATFYKIHTYLELFERALKLDGIRSMEYRRHLDLLAVSLEVKGFTLTQYIDIFKGFTKAVHNMINDHFNNIHQENLNKILKTLSPRQMLPRYRPAGNGADPDKLKLQISEIFFRDQIARSFGLQQLDRFLTRILHILYRQLEDLSGEKLRKLLLYDAQRAMTPIDNPNKWVEGLIHLGNKGYNLVQLNSFGLPVPPGFIITTEVFRCREIIETYEPANQNFMEQTERQLTRLERITGRKFGDAGRPLLLSVRSGSSISQPGMMDTFLDVGINEQIAEGIAGISGNPWFAWDNYRRFLQCYGMAMGLERDAFDALIHDHKNKRGIEFKRYFSGAQMKAVARDYRQYVLDHGFTVLDDPLEQLYMTITRVLSSWNSKKAQTYRQIMGISDDWGTAITVQTMVYGNLSRQSGTGVIFTHNPRWSGDRLGLWGDFTIGNQGEDVVAGLVNTLPISLSQQNIEMRDTDIILETHFPLIYNALKQWARELVDHRGWSPQELEFTFEEPAPDGLFVLQTRDMAIRQRQQVLTFDLRRSTDLRAMGHGIGVSGGAMSGRAVFDLQEIDYWRKAEPDSDLILLRNDTVPDDIREIHAADGLLTARGGVTSHAAVVAHGLGKVCVVGCSVLLCNENEKYCSFNGLVVRSGDYISIDGREGSVYRDRLVIKKT